MVVKPMYICPGTLNAWKLCYSSCVLISCVYIGRQGVQALSERCWQDSVWRGVCYKIGLKSLVITALCIFQVSVYVLIFFSLPNYFLCDPELHICAFPDFVFPFQNSFPLPFCTQTENPIYRAPETQHPNPLFQGKARELQEPTLPPTAGEFPTKL